MIAITTITIVNVLFFIIVFLFNYFLLSPIIGNHNYQLSIINSQFSPTSSCTSAAKSASAVAASIASAERASATEGTT
jgi:hypothetical protein